MKNRRFSILIIVITAICAGAVRLAITLKTALPLLLLRLSANPRHANAVGIIGGADGPTSIYVTGSGTSPFSTFTVIMALLALAGAVYLVFNGRK